MPRRRKDPADPALKPVAAKILDEFVHDGVLTAPEIDAAMRRFKKALIERALGAELTHHLGYCARGAETGRRTQPPQRAHRQDGADR
jgi:putative transposase